jgi:hypothetical protein
MTPQPNAFVGTMPENEPLITGGLYRFPLAAPYLPLRKGWSGGNIC